MNVPRPSGPSLAATLVPRPRGEQPRAANREEIERARASFLVDEPVPVGVVRKAILASWTRSRLSSVRHDRLDLGMEPGGDADTLLTRSAEPVLSQIADVFATEPVSVILCDSAGIVLSRRTGDAGLEHHLDQVWLAPGFSYAEGAVGTNGIGTALEARGPAHVFGHEHYADALGALACAGTPIHDPLTGKVLGVIDLTCWQEDAGSLLVATAATLARRIEEMLLDRSGQRELAVLSQYRAVCRRNRGPVFGICDDLVISNARARQQLDPVDRETLLAEAAEALSSSAARTLLIELPSARTARVHVRPTVGAHGVVGGVFHVQVIDEATVSTGHLAPLPRNLPLPSAVGSGVAWTKCCLAVDRHLRAGEWLVLEGEPGSGRKTVAQAAHQARTPAARLRVLRAEDAGPGWAGDAAEELAAGAGTVILADVDHLPPALVSELTEVLEPWRESTDAERPWVVATVAPLERDAEATLQPLLACFPRTIDVPPLRRHIEDLAELVPHFLSRLRHNAAPTCPPDVMRVLMHNRWPGNADQLLTVLRRIVAKRRAGVIELRDLPADCWTTGTRVLSPLESLECDAIVEALLDTAGNKVEAARRLGMSRATIYRKIRDYGIELPQPRSSGAEPDP